MHWCNYCCIHFSQLLSLSYVLILIKKVKGHISLKTLSSTWAVGWNGCCHISVLNSWTLPFCDQRKEEFKSSNFIFELLNFRPIWIYNFWTFELFLYLNVQSSIKQEFKSSKIIYSNRSKVQEFKNRVQNHKLVERHFIKWWTLSSDESYQVMNVIKWWKISSDESY